MEKLLRVGVIATTHGIRGEVKVFPTTDDINRFRVLKHAIIDTGRDKLPVEVQQVKFFKNMAILKFKDLDSINDVEKYRNCDLLVTRENAVPLEPDENFIGDLIGLPVITDQGQKLGVMTDVLKTGANDVYEVDMGEKKVLLPAIPSCILKVDLEKQQILVHVLDGLLDL